MLSNAANVARDALCSREESLVLLLPLFSPPPLYRSPRKFAKQVATDVNEVFVSVDSDYKACLRREIFSMSVRRCALHSRTSIPRAVSSICQNKAYRTN